jgi:hypothetical protein
MSFAAGTDLARRHAALQLTLRAHQAQPKGTLRASWRRWVDKTRNITESTTELVGPVLDFATYHFSHGGSLADNIRMLEGFLPRVERLETEQRRLFRFYFALRQAAAFTALARERVDLTVLDRAKALLEPHLGGHLPDQFEADGLRALATINVTKALVQRQLGDRRAADVSLEAGLEAIDGLVTTQSSGAVLTAGYRNHPRLLLVQFDLLNAVGDRKRAGEAFRAAVLAWNHDPTVGVFYSSMLIAQRAVLADSELQALEILPPPHDEETTQEPFVRNDCVPLTATSG